MSRLMRAEVLYKKPGRKRSHVKETTPQIEENSYVVKNASRRGGMGPAKEDKILEIKQKPCQKALDELSRVKYEQAESHIGVEKKAPYNRQSHNGADNTRFDNKKNEFSLHKAEWNANSNKKVARGKFMHTLEKREFQGGNTQKPNKKAYHYIQRKPRGGEYVDVEASVLWRKTCLAFGAFNEIDGNNLLIKCKNLFSLSVLDQMA